MNVALQNINSCNKMWAIYINFQKCRQNKKPRSNHFIRIPEVLPDTVMPELECFILAWTQATHSLRMPPRRPPPPLKKRSFWYLGGKWENWNASGVQSFYPDRPGEILSFPHPMPQSLHVTNCISHLFCHYKVQDYFRVCSSGDAVVPYKRSAWPLHVGSLS